MALNKYIYGAEVLYGIDPRNLDEAVKKKADELQREGYDLNTSYLPTVDGKLNVIFEKYLMIEDKDYRLPLIALVNSKYRR